MSLRPAKNCIQTAAMGHERCLSIALQRVHVHGQSRSGLQCVGKRHEQRKDPLRKPQRAWSLCPQAGRLGTGNRLQGGDVLGLIHAVAVFRRKMSQATVGAFAGRDVQFALAEDVLERREINSWRASRLHATLMSHTCFVAMK